MIALELLFISRMLYGGRQTVLLCQVDVNASVEDTTFGPVAEGARRQDVKDTEADANSKHGGGPSSLVFGSEGEDKTTKNTEADARSKRGGGPSSLFFGSEREDNRRPGDASIMVRSGQ